MSGSLGPGAHRELLAGVLVFCCAVAAPAPAADGDTAPGLAEIVDELDADQLASFGEEAEGLLALAAIDAGQMIRARELAEEMLRRDASSIAGHCVLGLVLGEAEGNLAGSAHYLERCLELFEGRYGRPGDGTPWFWHWMALDNLAQVLGDLGRRDEAFEVAGRIEALYGDDARYRTGWWHYRAGNYERARAEAVELITEADDPEDRVYGWNVLCAVEGDVGNLEAGLEACRQAVADDRSDGDVDPVQLTNAAEAARAMLLAGEAEELLLEATKLFRPRGVSLPWSELVLFYTAQARLSEALAALREAQGWRARQDAYVGALTWALQDLNAAHFLLVAGRADVAAQLSRRALERSDRYGRISTARREREGWAHLFDRAVHRTLAEMAREEASYSSWRDAVVHHWHALGHRLRAWQAGRRAATAFATERLLATRLAPHASGRVPLPEWLELDLVALMGPGVIEVALRRLDLEPPPDAVGAYALAFAAEAARLDGRPLASLDRTKLALAELPRWEALLRARLAAGAADAALASGDSAAAAAFLDLAWQIDPGVIRRQGLALPARFESTPDEEAREALALLRRSPRFAAADAGFAVRVRTRGDALAACLHGPAGAVLRCVAVESGPATAAEVMPRPRRLAREFHAQVFAPRVDLTQLDIRSLDGSTVVSGGGDAGVRWVLDELFESGAESE